MSFRLHATFALVLFALAVVVPMAIIVGVPAARLAAPRYGGGLTVLRDVPAHPVLDEQRAGEVDVDGVRLRLYVSDGGTFVFEDAPRVEATPLVKVSTSVLRAEDVRVQRHGDGLYTVRTPDGAVTLSVEPGSRRLVTENLESPRMVPSLIGLVSIAALVFALGRARLAVAYVRRMASWRPLSLTREGMLQDDGATVGTVETSARMPAGPVLVAPEALSGASVYRELAIVERKAIAPGTHAQWARGTALRLRDARVLSVLATLASAAAVLVHVVTR